MKGLVINMNRTKEQKVRLIYGIVLSVLLLISAVCLIAGCCHIYSFGDDAFTYERIGQTFSYISIPVYVTLAALIGGAVVHFAMPQSESRLRAERDDRLMLGRLSARASSLDCETAVAVNKERRKRRVLLYVNLALYAVGIGLSLAFILNVGNYMKDDINGSVVRMALVILACLILPVLMSIVSVYVNSRSVASELALIREALKQKKGTDAPVQAASDSCEECFFKRNKARIVTAARSAVVVIGVVFLLVGIFSGGMGYVLSNAISICTGCIGLG